MRLLLDTCALLWLVDDGDQLSARATALLDDDSNEVFVSVASYWEIVLKYNRGRLELPCPPDEWFHAAVDPDAIVNIEAADIEGVHRIGPPGDHTDPFLRDNAPAGAWSKPDHRPYLPASPSPEVALPCRWECCWWQHPPGGSVGTACG